MNKSEKRQSTNKQPGVKNGSTLGGRGFIAVVAPNVTKDLIPVMVNSIQSVE